jgi:hypothetical protein
MLLSLLSLRNINGLVIFLNLSKQSLSRSCSIGRANLSLNCLGSSAFLMGKFMQSLRNL